MDNFSEIKQVWLTANTNNLPTPAAFVKTVKAYQKKKIMKNIELLLLAILLGAAMVYTVFFYESVMLTTRIGEGLMFIAIFILIISYAASIRKAWKLRDLNNYDFISYLKRAQIKHVNSRKWAQGVGFILASTGLALYIFEAVHEHSTWMVIAYCMLTLWLLINWFITRPAANRRKAKQLNEQIQRLEKLAEQFSDN